MKLSFASLFFLECSDLGLKREKILAYNIKLKDFSFLPFIIFDSDSSCPSKGVIGVEGAAGDGGTD